MKSAKMSDKAPVTPPLTLPPLQREKSKGRKKPTFRNPCRRISKEAACFKLSIQGDWHRGPSAIGNSSSLFSPT